MRKIKQISFILVLLIGIIIFVGCDLFGGSSDSHKHSWELQTDGTLKCNSCKETVNKSYYGELVGSKTIKNPVFFTDGQYINTGSSAKNIVIYTTGEELTINAPNDTVTHYGTSSNVNIIAVANNSYHGYATITVKLTASSGNVELNANAKDVVIEAKTKVSFKLGQGNTVSTINVKYALGQTSADVSVDVVGTVSGKVDLDIPVKIKIETTSKIGEIVVDSENVVIIVDDTSVVTTFTDNKTPITSTTDGSDACFHKWDAGIVTKNPTCTEKGAKTVTCQRCGETSAQDITMTPHKTVSHNAIAATCTTTGCDAYETCANCSHTTYKELQVLGHDYKEQVVEPTETEGGYTIHECSRCKTSYTDTPTPMKNHSTHTYENGVCTKCHVIDESLCYLDGNTFEGFDRSIVTASEIVIPGTIKEITVKNIGCSCFKDMTSIESITLPETLTWIKSGAFSGCVEIESITIPASVKDIGSSAFSNCINLTNVVIKGSDVSIGVGAFLGCSNITDKTKIPSYAFEDPETLYTIFIENTERIGKEFMSGCSNTYFVSISDSVKIIDEKAFNGCINLMNVVIPDSVTKINAEAFKDCITMTDIALPSELTEIGQECFENCYNLASIGIPEKVTKIGNEAFVGCTSLTDIYIPKSSNSISGSPWGASKATIHWKTDSCQHNWMRKETWLSIIGTASGYSYGGDPGYADDTLFSEYECSKCGLRAIPDEIKISGIRENSVYNESLLFCYDNNRISSFCWTTFRHSGNSETNTYSGIENYTVEYGNVFTTVSYEWSSFQEYEYSRYADKSSATVVLKNNKLFNLESSGISTDTDLLDGNQRVHFFTKTNNYDENGFLVFSTETNRDDSWVNDCSYEFVYSLDSKGRLVSHDSTDGKIRSTITWDDTINKVNKIVRDENGYLYSIEYSFNANGLPASRTTGYNSELSSFETITYSWEFDENGLPMKNTEISSDRFLTNTIKRKFVFK